MAVAMLEKIPALKLKLDAHPLPLPRNIQPAETESLRVREQKLTC